MANNNLTGKDENLEAFTDRPSIKKLAYAVNAAAFGEIGCALAAVTESRRLSCLEVKTSPDDEIFSALSTAVHCYIAACIRQSCDSKSKASSGIIYAVQNTHSKTVKIGYTKDLKTRIGQLQTGCPHKLVVIKTLEGDKQMEAKIHSDLEDHRLNGEWFGWNDFVMSYINSLQEVDFNRDDIKDIYGDRT